MNKLNEQMSSEGAQPFSESVTILDLWKIVQRRRSFIFRLTAVLICLGTLAAIFTTRQYTSTGEIQIQKDSSDALGLGAEMSGDAATADALDANVTLQTQAKIL